MVQSPNINGESKHSISGLSVFLRRTLQVIIRYNLFSSLIISCRLVRLLLFTGGYNYRLTLYLVHSLTTKQFVVLFILKILWKKKYYPFVS